MMDVAEKEGIKVEPEVLEKAVGIPVVPMAASRGQGIVELEAAIEAMLQHKAEYRPNLPQILPAHKPVLEEVEELVTAYVPEIYPSDWVALKLLEGDEELSKLMQAKMPEAEWKKVGAILYKHEDAVLDIAGARYQWIGRMVRAAVVEPPASRMRCITRPTVLFFFTLSPSHPRRASRRRPRRPSPPAPGRWTYRARRRRGAPRAVPGPQSFRRPLPLSGRIGVSSSRAAR